jgi:hypothetical protein
MRARKVNEPICKDLRPNDSPTDPLCSRHGEGCIFDRLQGKVGGAMAQEVQGQEHDTWTLCQTRVCGDANSAFELLQNAIFMLYRRWVVDNSFKFEGNTIIIDDVPCGIYNG